MIEVNHLTKRFGSVTALDDISFQVESGSIFGLVGSNGAGKSTFLRTASGVYKPDMGWVAIDGFKPFENTAVKGKVCFISDYPYFPRTATIDDMVDLFSHTYPGWDKDLFEKLCACFPLDRKQRVNNMSKGMQRQAAILCALGARPTHLLLDEIFDGLDPVMRQLLKRILSGEVSERGMTIVIASHNLRELEDICDHVGLLHKGGILFSRDLSDMMLGMHKLQAAFAAPVQASDFPSLDILRFEPRGSLVTMTVRGDEREIQAAVAAMQPLFMELLPLSLEEIFINETEVAGYDIKKLVL